MAFLGHRRNCYRQARQKANYKGRFQSHLTSKILGNDDAATINGRLTADEQLGCKIIVLANVLEEFRTGLPTHLETVGPWSGVCTRIVHSHFVFQSIVVGSRKFLDVMKLFGMR